MVAYSVDVLHIYMQVAESGKLEEEGEK